jgi:hypothetical protein
MLFIFAYGGNYSPTNVTLHGITVLSQEENGNEMHILTNYSGDLASLEQNVNVTWDGSVGNAQLVISHGCAGSTTTPVPTQAPVVKTDECGTDNDVYHVPSVTGVVYKVGDTVVSGDVNTGGALSVTINAYPSSSAYTLTGDTTWTLTFTDMPCVTTVAPEPPTATTPNCEVPTMTVNLPAAQAGVVWSPSGSTTLQPNGGTITYTATPAANYQFSVGAQTSWTFTNNFNPANCPCGCETHNVTADQPKFRDVCGLRNDTYTIPSTDHVSYYVNGSNTAATVGVHHVSAVGTVTIEAVADQGYTLVGQHTWTHDFTNEPCKVRAPQVTFKDLCDVTNDTFTIPSKTGVEYQIGGQVIAAGTYNAYDYDVNGTVTVTAVALTGYQLTGTLHTWSMHFTNEECGGGSGGEIPATPGAATFTDVCETANDTYTIPATTGITYKVNGVVTAAGTYHATGMVTVTAEAQQGYVLNGTASWSHTFTNDTCGQVLGESFVLTPGKGAAVQAAQLANTGQNSLVSAIVAFVIATSAALVYAFAPKRQLS